MFSAKASVVKNLMVAGKLSILIASTQALAGEVDNPKFFEYRSGGFVNRLADVTFGWFKTLSDEEKSVYDQAITHAVLYSENGNGVRWQEGQASGLVTPVMTWPSSNGYCRRMHIQTYAYNVEKVVSSTACFDKNSEKWKWYSDKY